MKSVTFYICEVCERRYDDAESAQRCEAKCCNLSYSEYCRWRKLSKAVSKAGYKVGIENNPATRKKFDEACEALAAFESERPWLAMVKRPCGFY